MRREYIEQAGQFLNAKKVEGEINFMLFYRKLIIKLLVVFFLMTLCSLSFLLFGHELALYFTGNTDQYISSIFFGLIFFATTIAFYLFLKEDVFLKDSVKKAYQLRKIAPSM